MEHHSNIVPWQLLSEDHAAELASRTCPTTACSSSPRSTGSSPAHEDRGAAPRLNVLGTVNPVQKIARRAHEAGAVSWSTVLKRSRSARRRPRPRGRLLRPHRSQDLRPDRHRRPLRPPRAARGDAALPRRRGHDLLGRLLRLRWNDLPWKFEAGTSPYRRGHGARRRGRVDWTSSACRRIHAHEQELTGYALGRSRATSPGPHARPGAASAAARSSRSRRGRAPARRRRDPRARERQRPRRAPLRPAADAPPRRAGHVAGELRGAQTTRRTSTA